MTPDILYGTQMPLSMIKLNLPIVHLESLASCLLFHAAILPVM